MTMHAGSPQPLTADEDYSLAQVTDLDTRTNVAVVEQHQICFVSLRATTSALKNCLSLLDALRESSDNVNVEVAGLDRNHDLFILTLGIDLGPRKDIPQGSQTAIAAYTLMQTIFMKMFDFYPAFAAEPDAAARDHAQIMSNVMAEISAERKAAYPDQTAVG